MAGNTIFLVLIFLLIGCSSARTNIGPTHSTLKRNNSLNDSVTPGRSILYFSQYNRSGSCTLYVNKIEIGKVNYHHIIKLNVPAGKHKVLCYFNGRASNKWFNKYYDSFKNITMTAKSGAKHSVFYRWKYKKSHKMNRPYLIVYDKPSIVNPYVLKRSMIKTLRDTIDTNHNSVKESVAWERTLNSNSKIAYNDFLLKYPTSPNVEVAREAIVNIENKERLDFEKVKKSNKISEHLDYIDSFPNSIYRDEAITNTIKLIKMNKKNNRMANYQKLVELDSSVISKLPKSVQYHLKLSTVGPVEFNVAKIFKLKKSGLSPSIISAKVMATNKRYKNFEIDEILYLKKAGLNDSIVEAMLKVTANHDNQVKLITQNKEMMKQIQKLISKSQTQKRRPASTRYRRNVKSNSRSNSCLQRRLALEACRKVGGFMKTACEITARSTYPCSIR